MGDSWSLQVEALVTGNWIELADFPFVDKYIMGYSMVTFKDSLYLFGDIRFRSHTEFTIDLRWLQR